MGWRTNGTWDGEKKGDSPLFTMGWRTKWEPIIYYGMEVKMGEYIIYYGIENKMGAHDLLWDWGLI